MKPVAGSPLERPDCLFTVINQLILERQRRGFITSLGQRPRDIQTQKKRCRRNSCLQPLTISHQPSTQRNSSKPSITCRAELSPLTNHPAVRRSPLGRMRINNSSQLSSLNSQLPPNHRGHEEHRGLRLKSCAPLSAEALCVGGWAPKPWRRRHQQRVRGSPQGEEGSTLARPFHRRGIGQSASV
jgi:hypothetical protein